MNTIQFSSNIYISHSKIPKAKRGVFAKTLIKKDEVIEICPVFIFPRKDYKTLKQTALRNYYFMWGKVTVAVSFGFGSLYNHSYQANATYRKNIKDKTITFAAVKDILKDEEITVNYNYGKSNEKKKLWIEGIN